jgi:hypothetical protein
VVINVSFGQRISRRGREVFFGAAWEEFRIVFAVFNVVVSVFHLFFDLFALVNAVFVVNHFTVLFSAFYCFGGVGRVLLK